MNYSNRKILPMLMLGCLVAGVNSCAGSTPRISGAIEQEVYVWQRSWNDDVCMAVSTVASEFNGFVALGGEVSFDEGVPRFIRVDLNFETFRESGVPVGIALRIGPYPGPFNSDDETAAMLADIATGLVEDAEESGISVNELQIDFDCADSKLDGYRGWLDAIRSGIGSTPLTITALPSWLYRPEFSDLAESADGYVLQVHSLEPPTYVDDDFTLCDPVKSLEWIELAAELGLPFKVALPTYGYIVAFDSEGEFIGLSAEGQLMGWPTGTQIREVRSDPFETAGLVKSLTEDRPEDLVGLVWYRLPVAGDRLNWPWETLSAVMEGREPEISFSAEAQMESAELADIYLSNDW